MAKRSSRRELINTGTDKLYVRRDEKGQFKESDDVGRSLTSDRRHIFTLKVAYAQALTRVQGDPSRGISKNPAFLESMLVKFERALPFLSPASTVIEADAPALDDVVGELVSRVTPEKRSSSASPGH